ncbi:MAG: uracil-DNA glycosylase [Armatimonadota bacterium]
MVTREKDIIRIINDIAGCRKCSLCSGRKNAVPGEGSLKADIVFVGEGPGADEDIQGRPFVGRAGKLLSELLKGINLEREDVYITNIIKCRPPGNRNPKDEEIEICMPYLRDQIKLIKPKLICALGSFALKTLISKDLAITASRGRVFKKGGLYFFAVYHPAAALYNPVLVKDLKYDFLKLKKFIEEKL